MFPKLRLESLWTSEMADVEAGEISLGEVCDGSSTGSDAVELVIGGGRCERDGDGESRGPGDSSGTSLSLSDVSELSP